MRVDFVEGAAAHRRQFGGGAGQMIAKAVGVQPGIRPQVLDATAGLGRDAFVLASLGCEMDLIERQPLVAALLEDGLARACDDAEVAAIAARMHLHTGNAIELMQGWQGEAPGDLPRPDVPAPRQECAGEEGNAPVPPAGGRRPDAPALLAAALALATHRVVVKRPRKAPIIEGTKPSYALEGKSSRYDIYPKKALSKG